MAEDPEKKSNLIEDVIKSRLNHPFIGTLIASFVIKNYDILLILFTKLNKSDIYKGLEDFKSSLWNDEWRISLPILVTILIPFLLEPIVNLLHQKTLAYFRRLTRNLVENEEIKVIKDDYERLLRLSNIKDQEIDRLKKIINSWIRNLLEYIYLEKVNGKSDTHSNCYIFRSKEPLSQGDLVSISEREMVIYPYTNNDLPYGGRILSELYPLTYLVLLDYTFLWELGDNKFADHIEGTRFVYSHKQKTFVRSLGSEEVRSDQLIYAVANQSKRLKINVKQVNENFNKIYHADLINYLFDKNENKEKKRRQIWKSIFKFVLYPLVLLINLFKRRNRDTSIPSHEQSSDQVSSYYMKEDKR